MEQSDAMKDAAHFELAPDAKTRVIDCGQFSRTNTGAPFCACLKHPYCCGVDSGPEKCSFRTPKSKKPYQPKQKTGTHGGSTRAPKISGFMTQAEFAKKAGITYATAQKWVMKYQAELQGHISKYSGTLYIDEWAAYKLMEIKGRKDKNT